MEGKKEAISQPKTTQDDISLDSHGYERLNKIKKIINFI